MNRIYDFLKNPFSYRISVKNSMSGVIHLYADHQIPVKEVRKQLDNILNNYPQSDKHTVTIQIAESKKNHTCLRILSGSRDTNGGLDFQMEIREKLINFIDRKYPYCFVKTRVEKLA